MVSLLFTKKTAVSHHWLLLSWHPDSSAPWCSGGLTSSIRGMCAAGEYESGGEARVCTCWCCRGCWNSWEYWELGRVVAPPRDELALIDSDSRVLPCFLFRYSSRDT